MPESHLLLNVNNLSVAFNTDEGHVRALDNISFSLKKGETLGLVGESGSGKSVTALSIMRLLSSSSSKITNGAIYLEDTNILSLAESQMRKIRGNKISMIFQEPMTSLNPVFTVGDQIIEAIMVHQKITTKKALDKAIEMLSLVGISKEKINQYPHQLSGGMRQRIMIAMALSCNPDILIADEPTTALDVTIQAQILDLMKKLQRELSMSIILITHDLGVVAQTCDRVLVMYAGQIVEEALVDDLFLSPKHPYTIGLLNSVPGYRHQEKLIGLDGRERLRAIPGIVPDLKNLSPGCRFYERCFKKEPKCIEQEDIALTLEKNRTFRCLIPNDNFRVNHE